MNDYFFKLIIDILLRALRDHEVVIDNSVDKATIISIRLKSD